MSKKNDANISLPTTFLVTFILCTVVGIYLDKWLNTSPLFVILFIFYAIFMIFAKAYYMSDEEDE